MFVEAALEHFLNPVPSVEAVLRERLDDMHARFDHLEHDMRMIAETVALHARYHLAVVPPLPQSQQREAVILGDERFKILAEQVDRRVREGRPLIQETIDRLSCTEHQEVEQAMGAQPMHDSRLAHNASRAASEDRDLEQVPPASVKTGSGSSCAAQYPKTTAVSGGEPKFRAAEESDPESSTGKTKISREKPLSKWRLIFSVFLPFAAGYYLAFLFRTINAAISPALATDFGLDAAEIGLLASVYFLVFGLAQIPIGVFLDRFGPRRVQGVLLVIAAGGATLFGTASGFPELLVARATIGVGVAGSLMAGLKVIVTWFPRERVALANGWMIMLGSFGAVTATAPTDWLLEFVGWRGLFEILTIMTVAVAGLIYLVAPDHPGDSDSTTAARKTLTLWSVYSDPRFLRIAPLSAACIGSSWALHSLWASAWLADVERFDRQSRVTHLFLMALALSLGALLLGAMADRLRKHNIKTEVVLAAVGGLFVAAEIALVLRVPLPSLVPWSVVSIAGAATVLSFAVIADYFPREFAARANGALNLLHFGWAFAAQYAIGLVVEQWPAQDGHYPIIAYQAAFSLSLALQVAALVWFAIPWLRTFGRHLHVSLARPPAERDSRAEFVRVSLERPIVEANERTEW
jgi:MFS family permease